VAADSVDGILPNPQAVITDPDAFFEAAGRSQDRTHRFADEEGGPDGIGRVFVEVKRLVAAVPAGQESDQEVEGQTVGRMVADGLPGISLGTGVIASRMKLHGQFGSDADIVRKKAVMPPAFVAGRRTGRTIVLDLTLAGFPQGPHRRFVLADLDEKMGEAPVGNGIAVVFSEGGFVERAGFFQTSVPVGLDGGPVS